MTIIMPTIMGMSHRHDPPGNPMATKNIKNLHLSDRVDLGNFRNKSAVPVVTRQIAVVVGAVD
jgi:hypothetical protein